MDKRADLHVLHFICLSFSAHHPCLTCFCSLHQTDSASHFLHHSVYFCLTHPLSNSVTSPYVSHLSPHPLLPLLFCQMPDSSHVFIPPAVPLFPPTLPLLPHPHGFSLSFSSAPLSLSLVPSLSSFLLLLPLSPSSCAS